MNTDRSGRPNACSRPPRSSDSYSYNVVQHDERPDAISLLFVMVLVELQNTYRKIPRKMFERPNTCYIFEKLRVQRYQI